MTMWVLSFFDAFVNDKDGRKEQLFSLEECDGFLSF